MIPPELSRELSVAGWFKVFVPQSATSELIEEGTTIAIRLMPERDPLYVKRYDLSVPFSPGKSLLENEAKRFLETGILRVCGKIRGANIERGEVNGTHYAQLVVSVRADHWWLARFVSKPELGSYFLLHCNGDKDYLALAIAVFTEFYILE